MEQLREIKQHTNKILRLKKQIILTHTPNWKQKILTTE